MTSNELISELHDKCSEFNLNKKELGEIVHNFLELIEEKVAEGQRVSIFGRLYKLATRKSRTYRNPRTGEQGVSPERKFVSFRKAIA